jgi:hypothetical protein
MLEPVLVPIFKGMPKANILQNPAWGVILDCKDRQHILYSDLTTWSRSATCVTTSQGHGTNNLNKLVGLNSKSTASTVDLTETLTFPSTGLYRIEIEVYKYATHNGKIQFYDGGTQIEDVKSLTYKYGHYERIVYPVRTYNSGTHNLKITLGKVGYVSNIYIYPIKRYTAGSVSHEASTDILDISNIEFTMNAQTEMDTCTITAGLKNSYWNNLNKSLMVFGFTDSVTVLIGETKKDLTPMFGGYILGPTPSDDLSSFNINCVNRFLDMMRVPTYHDFHIPSSSADAKATAKKFLNFSSVYKIHEYLASTLDYPINCAGIPFDYGMNMDFSDTSQFDSVIEGGLKKAYDTGFGHPSPSLKLTPGNKPGLFECILWQGDQDVAQYSTFNLDYHVSGAGAKYPLKFDLKFTMYRTGESRLNAKDYIVRFTGVDKQTSIIGSYKQDVLSTWPSLNFNIKKLFDFFKNANSSEYHLVKLSLVGSITPSQANHPLCSAIWIDQIYTYSEVQQAPSYQSSGVNYPFDEIQDVCTATNHIAYIVPGLERRDDVLVVKPMEIALTDEVLNDGLNGNILEVTNWSDDPVSDGYKNQANRTFNKKISKTKTTPSNTFIQDTAAVIENGPFQDHEFWDDVNNQTVSDLKTTQYVQDHSTARKGYSTTIPGSTLIQPCHYIVANLTGSHIVTTDIIVTITQTLDIQNGSFKCTIDLNKPSLRYKKKIKGAIDQLKRNYGITGLNNNYRQITSTDTAGTSPGAFSEY